MKSIRQPEIRAAGSAGGSSLTGITGSQLSGFVRPCKVEGYQAISPPPIVLLTGSDLSVETHLARDSPNPLGQSFDYLYSPYLDIGVISSKHRLRDTSNPSRIFTGWPVANQFPFESISSRGSNRSKWMGEVSSVSTSMDKFFPRFSSVLSSPFPVPKSLGRNSLSFVPDGTTTRAKCARPKPSKAIEQRKGVDPNLWISWSNP